MCAKIESDLMSNATCAPPGHSLAVSETVISTILIVATPIPFIPQILKQVKQRSSAGLSISTMLLMVALNTFSCGAVLLKKWLQIVACEDDFPGCIPELLDAIQLFVLACCGMAVLCVLVAFPPFNTPRGRGAAAAVNGGTLVLWAACVLLNVYGEACGPNSIVLATIMDAVGATCALTMYLPQFLETLRQRQSGALSPAFYLLQAIGGYIIFIAQAFFSGDDWHVWAPMLISTVTQTACGALALYFDCRTLWIGDRSEEQQLNVNGRTSTSTASSFSNADPAAVSLLQNPHDASTES